jgi:hypothetical protein
MPSISNIRFQKTDQYSAIFICNEKQEPAAYRKMKARAEKLSKKYTNQFLPIFHSSEHKYATIRFHKSEFTSELNANDVVTLDYKIHRAAHGKRAVYCSLNHLLTVSRAVPDEIVDLSDSESE